VTVDYPVVLIAILSVAAVAMLLVLIIWGRR